MPTHSFASASFGRDGGSAGTPARTDERLATLYEYDPAILQLAKSTATDGTEVQYEYDPDGRVAKVTDATGKREFAYDLRGQVVKETVVLQHDAAADSIHYEIRRTYTKLGQPESVHLVSADGQSVALDHRIDYAWNDHSQLASVKSLAGEFAYGYDEANPALLTKMTGPAHEVETSYEPHRNLITGVVNRTKSSIGILPMARAGTPDSPPAAPSLTNVPASPNTAPAADSDPGTKNEEPSTLSSYTYANDLLGRRETISQGGDAFGMLKLGQNKVEVAYNDRSEVTGAVYRSNTETRQNFEYTYDAIGNRERTVSEIDSKRSELSYDTNSLNQYKKISANQRQLAVPYDLDGNLLEDTRNTYTWNADNNLIRVDAKDGSLRLEYIYDYQSRRTVRVETSNRGKENESRRTTYYLYDDWNLVAEHSAVTGHRSGATGEEADSVRYYTWGRDLSGSLQGAGGVGGLLAISESSPGADIPGEAQLKTSNLKLETLFPTYDANGNIGQLINADANVVAVYAYDPFGNVTEMAGAEAAENPWRFSTKPVEAGTGWLYYGYRWYDSEMGHWVNRDPIEERGGVNLYGFVGNDGVGGVDVLGLLVGNQFRADASGTIMADENSIMGGHFLDYEIHWYQGCEESPDGAAEAFAEEGGGDSSNVHYFADGGNLLWFGITTEVETRVKIKAVSCGSESTGTKLEGHVIVEWYSKIDISLPIKGVGVTPGPLSARTLKGSDSIPISVDCCCYSGATN